MNEETLNLIERPYLEIVDDLLTATAGGVVNEPIVFDVKADLYPLAEPARDLRGVTGTAAERHHVFLKEIDFAFSEGDNGVAWLDGGTRPDDETTFYVDYFRRDSRSPLTDLNVGSVTRTVMEAIGREIATVYQQINRAYLSAFIDTAEGKSLDLVVAILGVTRKTSEFAEGLVTFFRDPAVAGNITIAEGTVLTTAKGEALFEATQPRTLQVGQARIDVPVRAGVDFPGDAGLVEAGAISEMVLPVAGIARVTNLEATQRAASDETDEELRLRAKVRLRALGKATLFALDRVIRELRAKPIEFWDPAGPPAQRSEPGTAAVLVEAEPERFPSLRAAVEETRAAGVRVAVVARYVFFTPRLVATIAPGLTAAGKDKVKEEVIAALQAYVDGLTSGEPAAGAKLLEAVASVKEISDPKIVDVLAFRSDLGQGGAATLTDRLLETVAATPAEELRDAFSRLIEEAAPLAPTGARTADRGLVQSTAEESAGQRASDEDIESGRFQVSATVDGEPWWVVLDMGPADVVLQEGGEGAG